MKKPIVIALTALLTAVGASAQSKLGGLEYKAEVQASVSYGKTPLWLNANKYGLSSLDKQNGYVRAAVVRPLSADSARRWGLGYGVDAVLPVNYTSKTILQQAFAEVRWLHGVVSVGAKEHSMELKNNQLSSGSQTLGINARPVPQVRIALPEYWTVPFTRGWLHLKGHIAYGKMTDDNWQHDFTGRKSKYADNVLYHSKAGYLKIGNEDVFCPWSLELGLEMAAEFGGTAYRFADDGTVTELKGETGLKALWHAFKPGGGEAGEDTYLNVAGNQLGSFQARINYESDSWKWGFYADKYFEDHSSMLMLDYDGYGQGSEWNVHKKRRYFLYDPKDWLLGTELSYKYDRIVKSVVLEYMYTKYQSGPIYHDHTEGLSTHIGGIDNFYNHYIYTGWQHWGQVIGNPLYLSPIYNDDGTIRVKNNRFMAFHLGASGVLTDNLTYRLLATWQEGLGTYPNVAYGSPFNKKRQSVSVLAEATYDFSDESALKGWSVRGAYGMDMGGIIGHNYGFQLTIVKSGLLTSK